MIRYVITLFILNFTFLLKAQEPYYKSYSWELNPNYKALKVNPEEAIIAFKDKVVTEFYFEENNFVEFFIEHQVLWLNSNEKIEEYNKVYIPYNSSSEILANKARVITRSGKVIELDQSKILTAEDEETKKTYKYFAFEGVEKGSFIEYYYIIKRIPKYKGRKIFMQSSYDIKNADFEVYAPKNLEFKFKSYNGLAEVILDTLEKDKLHWKLSLDSIEKIENEENAPYNTLRKYLIYKLYRNAASNNYDISSYRNVTKNVYNYLHIKFTGEEAKIINEISQLAGLDEANEEIENIRKLENYLKGNYFYSDIASNQLEDIKSVHKTKTANETGLLQIYIAVLKNLGIKTEIVLTCDRMDTRFDQDFEASNFLTHYLLYFPSVDKYTAVKLIESRVGFPPAELTDNYGLFIKEVSIGTYKAGVGQIKYIETPVASQSGEKMTIDVFFDKMDLSVCQIKFDRIMMGYFAMFIQPFLSIANEESLNELYDELIKSINENMTIKSKKTYNDKSELFGIEPFRIVAEVETNAFVDKAGKKYLFKIGELIGPQIEMYQEKGRHLPLEDDFKRTYERTINIEIPKGYKITNLNDINIENSLIKEEKKIFEFQSRYKLDGNQLVVYVDEYYRQNHVELDIFDDYRKVVNSAADFNKVVLIIEPK